MQPAARRPRWHLLASTSPSAPRLLLLDQPILALLLQHQRLAASGAEAVRHILLAELHGRGIAVDRHLRRLDGYLDVAFALDAGSAVSFPGFAVLAFRRLEVAAVCTQVAFHVLRAPGFGPILDSLD